MTDRKGDNILEIPILGTDRTSDDIGNTNLITDSVSSLICKKQFIYYLLTCLPGCI